MSPSTALRKIQLKRLANVNYQHVNLEKACEFLEDFGFQRVENQNSKDKIYYRGYGTEPYVYMASRGEKNEFLGPSFAVESLEQLELAKEQLPSATDIYDLDAPGGGKCVTFKDPVDGFKYHLVYGQQPRENTDDMPELRYNFPNSKHRPVNKTQRFEQGPAPIHKVGHFGLCTTDYEAMLKFFTTNFNFTPSNTVYDDKGQDMTVFMHLDLGSEWVDHHTFFFFEGPKAPHVHHSSFEIHDFDVQLLGHQWLVSKKWEPSWGVGRHVLGSQIFDYWWDPSGFMVEHYVDGDLVNDETEMVRIKAGPESLYVWGPDLPATFLT